MIALYKFSEILRVQARRQCSGADKIAKHHSEVDTLRQISFWRRPPSELVLSYYYRCSDECGTAIGAKFRAGRFVVTTGRTNARRRGAALIAEPGEI
jgi:hypothetical protein